jgi:hypothetical protein
MRSTFKPLLDQIADMENVVVAGDAVHTQRKHASYLHKRKAHYVFPVLGNQPGLFDQLDALAWDQIPIGWMTYDRGHGRQEIRTIQTMPAPKSTRFPHAAQVFLIERHVHDLAGKPLSSIAVLGITDLTAAQSGPRRLAEFVRGQWSIENRDHYVRDVTFGEDRCRIRAAATPSILATMRSYAISTLRLLGFTNIAEATRWARATSPTHSSPYVSHSENAVSPGHRPVSLVRSGKEMSALTARLAQEWRTAFKCTDLLYVLSAAPAAVTGREELPNKILARVQEGRSILMDMLWRVEQRLGTSRYPGTCLRSGELERPRRLFPYRGMARPARRCDDRRSFPVVVDICSEARAWCRRSGALLRRNDGRRRIATTSAAARVSGSEISLQVPSTASS